ncbi:MAG: hypothetical protein Tp139DCM904402_26 [Prokaryotic dsDNA virus sp.]|nr:MAG: hypothetical protein Tp139DCM904402_26 [Prokaryotic dsDNA virus sp.]
MTVVLTAAEKDRNKYIGGSDVAKIMSGDWYDLWLEKTGQVKHPDLSDVFQVQLGTVTEAFNIEWFYKNYLTCAKQNKIEGINPRQLFGKKDERFMRGEFGKKDERFMRGNLDDVCIDGSGRICAIEAKHTSALGMRFKNMDEAIEEYMPQMQFYLYLLHQNFSTDDDYYTVGGCYFPIIFGNVWHCVKVSSYAGYQIDMVDAIHRFKKHVDKFDPKCPEATAPPKYKTKQTDVDIDKIPVNGGIKVDMSQSNSFINDANNYIKTKNESDKTQSKLKETRKFLLEHVPDNAREVYSPLLNIKRDTKGTLRVNIKGE